MLLYDKRILHNSKSVTLSVMTVYIIHALLCRWVWKHTKTKVSFQKNYRELHVIALWHKLKFRFQPIENIWCRHCVAICDWRFFIIFLIALTFCHITDMLWEKFQRILLLKMKNLCCNSKYFSCLFNNDSQVYLFCLKTPVVLPKTLTKTSMNVTHRDTHWVTRVTKS